VLAQIHAIPLEGLPEVAHSSALVELEKYEAVYRACGAERPIIEAALVHLKRHAPALERQTLVHGDFRNGNLMIHPEDGLRAVLDWELAHLGDPAEDLGWICVNSWRFGNHAKPVGGFGDYNQLLDAYEAAGGTPIALERVKYWQMLGSMKWGIMCILQCSAHMSGFSRSHELAAIGRRVCENEHDLFLALEGRW
jgi:aminoglycoside phosphotransferase (APT) family kinase protein